MRYPVLSAARPGRSHGAQSQSEVARGLLDVDNPRQHRCRRGDSAGHCSNSRSTYRGGSNSRHSLRADDRGRAPDDGRRASCSRRQISRFAVESSRRCLRARQDDRHCRGGADRPSDGAPRARLWHEDSLLGPAPQTGGRARAWHGARRA